MASFPKLFTGALAQYGSIYENAFRTKVIRYVDGSEQRYPERGVSGRRWTLAFKHLTPAELGSIRAFLREQRGREGTFSFTDPWTGVEHANCSFDNDVVRFQATDEWDASTTLVICEVKP